MRKIDENVEIFNIELRKRTDDINFLKSSFEDQRERVEKEHEMISDCLYELASQFMNFKNEIIMKISSKDDDNSSSSSENKNE